jgi:hypothetical protein
MNEKNKTKAKKWEICYLYYTDTYVHTYFEHNLFFPCQIKPVIIIC